VAVAFDIFGREAELASLDAFIGEMEGGPAALVLEGEAGVGKTTLWGAGVERARARGLRVLSSRPAEAERGLGNVGLGDLLEGVVDEVLPALVAPSSRSRCSGRRRRAIPSIGGRLRWQCTMGCSF
jgi:AAA ATPase domain